jgi:hypothetical protein
MDKFKRWFFSSEVQDWLMLIAAILVGLFFFVDGN